MMLQDGRFRGYDYVENNADIDVAQQQDFLGFRPQLLDKSGFLFPLRQVKDWKFLVVKDFAYS